MQALLAFEQGPPVAAPVRFFLTAPFYLVLAGVLLALEGEGIFASRWTPATLAVTHLLTLGFMLQIMLGALIQILPVLAGAHLPRPRLVAGLVHPLLNGGVPALALGFLLGDARWMYGAATCLILALGIFLAASGWALWRVRSTSPSIRGLKMALLALLITGGSGLYMLLALAGGWPVALERLTNLHAGWGLGGWSAILLAAVAYVVVPMFQLTPGYPARPAWWFPRLVFSALLLWSLGVLAGWDWLAADARLILSLLGLFFVIQTLRLQRQRRRARPDATFRYWQFGLYVLLLVLLMVLAQSLSPSLAEIEGWSLLLGGLVLLGGYVAFIIGMLYKIVPFLLWFDLQNRSAIGKPPPAMNRLLSENESMRQLQLFYLACAGVLAAGVWPAGLALPAGVLLLSCGAALWLNVGRAFWRYRAFRRAAVGSAR
ncbi:hypothetical protein [Azonexus sp.]|uniref:hypothetical protein n=1 Tax=Azonexus sp. TaxID=1872668 RepID=UPI0039E25F67